MREFHGNGTTIGAWLTTHQGGHDTKAPLKRIVSSCSGPKSDIAWWTTCSWRLVLNFSNRTTR
jgi:hypothetical protein